MFDVIIIVIKYLFQYRIKYFFFASLFRLNKKDLSKYSSGSKSKVSKRKGFEFFFAIFFFFFEQFLFTLAGVLSSSLLYLFLFHCKVSPFTSAIFSVSPKLFFCGLRSYLNVLYVTFSYPFSIFLYLVQELISHLLTLTSLTR